MVSTQIQHDTRPDSQRWLELAKEGLPWPDDSDRYIGNFSTRIQMAVDNGMVYKRHLDEMTEDAANAYFYINYQGFSLRFYLAAREGKLDGLETIEDALVAIGVGREDGTLVEAWQ